MKLPIRTLIFQKREMSQSKIIIRLRHTYRIQRPDYRDLNPFINASDPKNIVEGNPTLKPEIGNNIEAGYNKSFKKGGNLNIVLFYRRTDQDIQQYLTYYSALKVGDTTYYNTALTNYINVGSEQNTGINLFGSLPASSKLTLRSNLSVFYRYITYQSENISSLNYRFNINATYQFSKTLIAEFFGNFNSARNEIQGRYPSYTTYNMAIRKTFWKDKASIAITGTNVFNEYIEQPTQLSGIGFTESGLRQIQYRSFGINFTYKFGKLEFKKGKEEDDKQDNQEGM